MITAEKRFKKAFKRFRKEKEDLVIIKNLIRIAEGGWTTNEVEDCICIITNKKGLLKLRDDINCNYNYRWFMKKNKEC